LKEDINLIIEYKKKLKIDLNPNKNSFPLKNLNENEEIKNYLKTNQIGAINFFEKNIIEKNIKNNLLIGGPGSGKTIVFLITSIIILNNIKNSKIINNKNCKMVVNLINNNSNVEMQKFYFNIINEGIYENLIYEKQLYDIKDIKNIIFNKKNYEEIDFLSEDVNFIVNKDKFWC
jgi:energy-coupling factor transporter ATP-binding protein EcfA2